MADDTRDEDLNGSTAATGTTAAGPPKKLPKGIVIGKDGKP
jgi:hypothetical protein